LTKLEKKSFVHRVFRVLNDIYTVFSVDMRFINRHRLRTTLTSLVKAFLYLLAFGFGLGEGISFEGFSYLDFVIPGIIALTAMSSSYSGAGTKLNVDRLFHRSFDELLMAPISLFSVIVGKALIGVFRGLIASIALLLVGAFFSSSLMINPILIFTIFISCLVFSLLGVLIAISARTHRDMNTFSSLVLMPMTFLSGTFFSLNQLPEAAKSVLYFLPLSHSSQCMRAAALGQAFPWISLIAFMVFGLLLFICCFVVLKQSSV